MRREERVTVQGPVTEQQPDGMSHGGGGRGSLFKISFFTRGKFFVLGEWVVWPGGSARSPPLRPVDMHIPGWSAIGPAPLLGGVLPGPSLVPPLLCPFRIERHYTIRLWARPRGALSKRNVGIQGYVGWLARSKE